MAARISCDGCRSLVPRGQAVERRAEYRTVREQARLRTWRRAVLCRGCAEGEWAEHDGTAAPSGAPPAVPADPRQPLTEDEAVASVLAHFPGAELVTETARPVQPWPPAGTVFVDHPGGYRTICRDPRPVARPCGWCGGALGTDAVEVRREYRALGSLARLRTWTVGTVCRPCADARAAEHDRGGRPAVPELVAQ